MKRLLLLIFLASLLFSPSGVAAPAQIVVSDLKLLASIGNVGEVSGIVTSGATVVIYGTKLERSFVRTINATGEELWKVDLEPQVQSIATCAAIDNTGNIWIAGSISQIPPTPTPLPSASTLNPDNVSAVSEDFDTSLRTIVLWKIDKNTQEVSKFTLENTSPVLITSIAVDQNGVSIAGIAATNNGSSGFVVSTGLSGEFGKPLSIGSESTTLDAVVRHSDGSLSVVGSSAETLKGKKLVGTTDGIIVKISKSNQVLSVVRSSATKSMRNWNSATSSLLLAGEVISGKVIKSAVTKFSSSYVPSWTHRFTSTGQAFTSGSTYAFFASVGPVTQLARWSPKAPRPLLLSFDAKGSVIAAYAAPTSQSKVLGLVSSKSLGPLCLSADKETVSIFSLN